MESHSLKLFRQVQRLFSKRKLRPIVSLNSALHWPQSKLTHPQLTHRYYLYNSLMHYSVQKALHKRVYLLYDCFREYTNQATQLTDQFSVVPFVMLSMRHIAIPL